MVLKDQSERPAEAPPSPPKGNHPGLRLVLK